MADTPRITVPVDEQVIKRLQEEADHPGLGDSVMVFGPDLRALLRAYRSLSAAPAPEGGVVDDGAIKIATDLHKAYEQLIYGMPRYLDAENLTDEENMIREAWITLDATAHRLAALATREEAPAEAGELSEAMERLGPAADFLEGDCVIVGDHEVRGNDLLIVLSSLRAQPPAREGAQPAVWIRAQDLRGLEESRQQGRDGYTTVYLAQEPRGYVEEPRVALYTRPAPDALRGAVEALTVARSQAERGADKAGCDGWRSQEMCRQVVQLIDQALAALQAEQKGGA